MAGEASDELRMLRERAYGPDADIDTDPEAAERWAQLEREAAEPDAAPEALVAERPAPESAPGSVREEPDPESPTAPAPARRRRIRIPLLWVATVAAALLVGFGLARFAVEYARFHPLGPSAEQVAVLEVDPSIPVPKFVTGDLSDPGATVHDDFLGMRTVVTDEGSALVAGDQRCMTILTVAGAEQDDAEATDSYSIVGPVFWGCSAGRFPATVSVAVSEDFPEEFRAEYPVGTGLQFVFDEQEDAVVVFADR